MCRSTSEGSGLQPRRASHRRRPPLALPRRRAHPAAGCSPLASHSSWLRRDEGRGGKPGDLERIGAAGVAMRIGRRVHGRYGNRVWLLQLHRLLVISLPFLCLFPSLLRVRRALRFGKDAIFLIPVIILRIKRGDSWNSPRTHNVCTSWF